MEKTVTERYAGMMRNYVRTSLETHLFFGRIMMEHSLFLLVGFPQGETRCIERAASFHKEFEQALERAVQLANGMVSEAVLASGEVVTEFTEVAERQTSSLMKLPINLSLTQAEQKLQAGFPNNLSRAMVQQVKNLNHRILRLLNGLIEFKEQIWREVGRCTLYTTNYPLLIEHILREAKLYRQMISELENRGNVASQDMRSMELFWNQIMMEHAQFIRGLLDPTECELMETADNFAEEYCRLLERARVQDCKATEEMTARARETTERYRDFKAAGTEGIIGCNIRSIILPLLADHVLREANHYLRILGVS